MIFYLLGADENTWKQNQQYWKTILNSSKCIFKTIVTSTNDALSLTPRSLVSLELAVEILHWWQWDSSISFGHKIWGRIENMSYFCMNLKPNDNIWSTMEALGRYVPADSLKSSVICHSTKVQTGFCDIRRYVYITETPQCKCHSQDIYKNVNCTTHQA